MFGFRRRAQVVAANHAAAWSAACEGTRARLLAQVDEVFASATAQPGVTLTDREAYAATAEALRKGIDAVLTGGADAFGSEMQDAEQGIKAGAMLAHAARNLAFLSGRLANPNTDGDIRFAMLGHR